MALVFLFNIFLPFNLLSIWSDLIFTLYLFSGALGMVICVP